MKGLPEFELRVLVSAGFSGPLNTKHEKLRSEVYTKVNLV